MGKAPSKGREIVATAIHRQWLVPLGDHERDKWLVADLIDRALKVARQHAFDEAASLVRRRGSYGDDALASRIEDLGWSQPQEDATND